MFVAGIDPGLSRCGFAVLDVSERRARPVVIDVIRTDPGDALPDRLGQLSRRLTSVFAEYRPEACAVERVFFQTNVKTAISVAQASGVAIAAAVQAGARVVEYTPNQVKETVAGYGAAPKAQIQEMVQRLLGLAEVPSPADAADAAAVALCHLAFEPVRQAARRHPAATPSGPRGSRPAGAASGPPRGGLRAVNSGVAEGARR